jgi:hypothetical protein
VLRYLTSIDTSTQKHAMNISGIKLLHLVHPLKFCWAALSVVTWTLLCYDIVARMVVHAVFIFCMLCFAVAFLDTTSYWAHYVAVVFVCRDNQ